MSLADFDAIIIRRKPTKKKTKQKVKLAEFDSLLSDVKSIAKSMPESVDKSGDNKDLSVRILFCNDIERTYNIPDTTIISQFINKLKEELGIQSDLFFLCELLDEKEFSVKRYLNSQRTFYQESVESGCVLSLQMKYIGKIQQSVDPVTYEYIFHCIRKKIVGCNTPIERINASVLASFLIILDKCVDNYDLNKYLNKCVINVNGENNLKRSIDSVLHKLASQQLSDIDIYAKFIDTFVKSKVYGVTIFQGIVSGRLCKIGLVWDGIIIFFSDNVEDLQFYPMKDIESAFVTESGDCLIKQKGGKKLLIKSNFVFEIVSVLSGYYYILGYSSETVEKQPEVQSLIDGKYFNVNDPRQEIAFFDNRLEYFNLMLTLVCNDNGLSNNTGIDFPIKFKQDLIQARKEKINLMSFDFKCSNISLQQLQSFATAIEKTFMARGAKKTEEKINAQELLLSSNPNLGKTEEFVKAVNTILKTPIAIKKIDFSNLGLESEIAKGLGDGIRACNSLDNLNLKNNPLLGVGLINLVKSINVNSITRLNLSNTGIDKNSGVNVINAIQSFKNIRVLILRNNKIETAASKLVQILPKLQKLEVLDLRNCNIPKDIMNMIVHSFTSNKVLKEFRVSGNEGLDDVVDDICSLSEKLKFPPIFRLDIGGNGISSGTFKKLLKHISKPQNNLQHFDVSNNKFGKDFSKFCETLKQYEEKGIKSIVSLDVSKSNIPESVQGMFWDYIAKTTLLKKLNISENTSLFTKSDVSLISNFIRENKTLVELKLNRLGISANSISAIFDSIQNHPSISKLSLDGNDFNGSFNAIKDLIVADDKLQVINLRYLNMNDPEQIVCFCNSLPPTVIISEIHLEGNNISQDMIKKAIDEHPNVSFFI